MTVYAKHGLTVTAKRNKGGSATGTDNRIVESVETIPAAL